MLIKQGVGAGTDFHHDHGYVTCQSTVLSAARISAEVFPSRPLFPQVEGPVEAVFLVVGVNQVRPSEVVVNRESGIQSAKW